MSPESSAKGWRGGRLDAGEPGSSASPLDPSPGSGGRQQGRQHFQQQLQELETRALGGLDLIVEQLDRVLEALNHQDVELAQMVIADDDRVDGRYLEVHQGILSLLALQAPVAGDLRVVAALLHVMKGIERMGDQCVNIAKLIPLSGHEPPVRRELLDALLKMGAYARSEVTQSKAAFAGRDVPHTLVPPTGQPPQKSYRDWNVGYPEASWVVAEPGIYYQSGYVKLLSKDRKSVV